ncbi:hypothetical protein [Timonella sp. A28]|uniref:hypothetical protein n=1 Tax=Timonella sp. A28 TaxID=3442640 RepID=UPI003EC0F2E3
MRSVYHARTSRKVAALATAFVVASATAFAAPATAVKDAEPGTDVKVTKSANRDTVSKPGDVISYTVTVERPAGSETTIFALEDDLYEVADDIKPLTEKDVRVSGAEPDYDIFYEDDVLTFAGVFGGGNTVTLKYDVVYSGKGDKKLYSVAEAVIVEFPDEYWEVQEDPNEPSSTESPTSEPSVEATEEPVPAPKESAPVEPLSTEPSEEAAPEASVETPAEEVTEAPKEESSETSAEETTQEGTTTKTSAPEPATETAAPAPAVEEEAAVETAPKAEPTTDSRKDEPKAEKAKTVEPQKPLQAEEPEAVLKAMEDDVQQLNQSYIDQFVAFAEFEGLAYAYSGAESLVEYVKEGQAGKPAPEKPEETTKPVVAEGDDVQPTSSGTQGQLAETGASGVVIASIIAGVVLAIGGVFVALAARNRKRALTAENI